MAPPASVTVFRSKVDAWFVVAMGAAGLFCVSSLRALPVSQMGMDGWWFALACLASAFGIPLWALANTCYTVTASQLQVRCGPFLWNIALADIDALEPSRNWLSSPALSLDRLRIRYGHHRSLLISPRDRQRFIQLMRAACPHAHITGF